MNRKRIRTAALLLAFVCLLSMAGCKGDDGGDGQPPADGEEAQVQESGQPGESEQPAESERPEYAVGEERIAALTPEGGDQVTERVATVYTYSGLTDSGGTAAGYVEQMTAAESGFLVVDEEFVQTENADYSKEEGAVRLARNAAAEGRVITVLLTWSEGLCAVSVEETEGTVTIPPEPVPLTLTEAVDYLKSLPPETLGLSGSSMDGYRVHIQDGAVLVDGQPCLSLQVYDSDNPEQANDLAGSYLMTADGRHLYRLDTAAGTVEELDV